MLMLRSCADDVAFNQTCQATLVNDFSVCYEYVYAPRPRPTIRQATTAKGGIGKSVNFR